MRNFQLLRVFSALVAFSPNTFGGGDGYLAPVIPEPALAVDAGMLADVHFALEGPGSVPLKSGAVTARGMFNRGTELAKLGTLGMIEATDAVLFIAYDRLPAVTVESFVQVGAASMPGTNSVQASDPTYRVGRRFPVHDGLIHALVLEGGA